MTITALVNVGLVIANLIILGLNLKLYTEALKDRNMERRSKP